MQGVIKRTMVAAAVTGAVVLAVSKSARRAATQRARRASRVVERGATRRVRRLRGLLAGQRYRLSGASPDPDVGDDVLADRVRSSLGPLEKRRDLPHVHVAVRNRIAVLHGELPTAEDVYEVERAVLRVPGVDSLESHLHVGLTSGMTRPSEGDAAHRRQPSDGLVSLLEAATSAGVSASEARTAVRAVLGTFTDRLPSPTRDQLLAHLPADARALVGPASHAGTTLHARTVPELVASVAERGLASEQAVTVTESVLARVRDLVPEEVADVAAVLPPDLRELWIRAVPA